MKAKLMGALTALALAGPTMAATCTSQTAWAPLGKPIWFTMVPGEWSYYNTFTGPIYRTTGPYFDGPFDPTKVTRTIVGQGTLTFADRNAGTFTYTIQPLVPGISFDPQGTGSVKMMLNPDNGQWRYLEPSANRPCC